MKTKITHGSLFSGIGGFDLAAEKAGWENVFHCEINPFGQKVLKHYWPNAISYADITKTDFTIHRGTIDVISGGFPCQPFSLAGKRKGTADDRHLWPQMLRAILEIQPSYIVGENVHGIVNWDRGMVFDQVHIDLENAGYQIQPVILPACSVNAPHKRERVWFIAYSESKRGRFKLDINRNKWIQPDSEGWERMGKQYSNISRNGITPNSDLHGQQWSNGKHEIDTSKRRINALNDIEQVVTSNPHSRRQSSKEHWKKKSRWVTETSVPNYWRNFPTQPRFVAEMMGFPPNWTELPFQNGETNP